MGTAQVGSRAGEVLTAIERLTARSKGRSPSVRELALEMRLSTTRVRQHLETLERAGLIEPREARVARDIRLVGTAA